MRYSSDKATRFFVPRERQLGPLPWFVCDRLLDWNGNNIYERFLTRDEAWAYARKLNAFEAKA